MAASHTPSTTETPPASPLNPPSYTTFHPARTLSNIKNYVPIVLDSDQSQYDTCVELFRCIAISNGVLDHIDPTVPRPSSMSPALWEEINNTVKSWIYSTISLDLIRTIIKPNSTALDLWTQFQDQFLDNKHTRTIYLEQRLNNIKLENYNDCTSYCQDLKLISDQLHNLGNGLTDHKLVLRLVAGLTPKYKTVGSFISHSNPLPSFAKARSMLLLEESNLKTTDPPENTAFAAPPPLFSPTSATQPAPTSHSYSARHRGGGLLGVLSHRGGGGEMAWWWSLVKRRAATFIFFLSFSLS